MPEQLRLLTVADGPAVSLVNARGKSPVLLVCEHACNRIPARLGTLGVSPEVLEAHVAWDPGALQVALMLSEILDAELFHQNFSRLVYDCNRPPEAADAMAAVSEIFDIPGNVDIAAAERQARIDEIYAPFRDGLDDVIAGRLSKGRETVLMTIHSFTPVYRGVRRETEIGILHDSDTRLADQMLARGEPSGRFVIRRNQPYGPADGVTHTLKEHGLANGLMNVMIEVRNDLIRDEASQGVVAGFLAELTKQSLAVHA